MGIKLGTYESWFDGEVIVPGDTLEERLANLEAWGYQGIQLCTLSRGLSKQEVEEAIDASPVELCIWGGGGGLLSADPAERAQAVKDISDGLYEAAEMGAVGSIVVPIRVQPEIEATGGKSVVEIEREILVGELAEIAPAAEESGACVILEPLNRYETHFVKYVRQAADICREVGSPGIKMMADFFHMNIEEVDLGEAIEDVADTLAYVHLADSNRYEPGAGHLDFRPGLAALKRIGYDGFMTLECRIMAEDKGQALQDAAKLIREIWEEV